jgi:hypothetical protein
MEKNRNITQRSGTRIESHWCQPGYHWVNAHTRRKGRGLGTEYVRGHCEKNRNRSEFRVTKMITKSKINLRFLEMERTIEEEPIDDNSNSSDFQN